MSSWFSSPDYPDPVASTAPIPTTSTATVVAEGELEAKNLLKKKKGYAADNYTGPEGLAPLAASEKDAKVILG